MRDLGSRVICDHLNDLLSAIQLRAGDGIRTRDLLLGKETYYHCTTPAGASFCLPLRSKALTGALYRKPAGCQDRGGLSFEWTRPDSNRRSSPCKGDAFPLGHGPNCTDLYCTRPFWERKIQANIASAAHSLPLHDMMIYSRGCESRYRSART